MRRRAATELKESISPSCQLSPLLSSLLYSSLLLLLFSLSISHILYLFSSYLPSCPLLLLPPSFLPLVYSSPSLRFAALRFTTIRFTPPLPFPLSSTDSPSHFPAFLLYYHSILFIVFPLPTYSSLLHSTVNCSTVAALTADKVTSHEHRQSVCRTAI
jgi:hypothetical protein